MAKRTRKPIAVFEHGTRIYAPVDGERRHRIVARDAATGERLFVAAGSEQAARLRGVDAAALLAALNRRAVLPSLTVLDSSCLDTRPVEQEYAHVD